ncbi:4Fe-4S binding protein [Moorella sulfitireducens]
MPGCLLCGYCTEVCPRFAIRMRMIYKACYGSAGEVLLRSHTLSKSCP